MKDETAQASFLQTVKDEFSHEISEFCSFRRRGTLPLGDMEETNLFTTPSISLQPGTARSDNIVAAHWLDLYKEVCAKIQTSDEISFKLLGLQRFSLE